MEVAADAPKLRLLIGGSLIEGEQLTLAELPREERGGISELVRFLGGPKHVLILQNPVVHQGSERVETQYLVIRQDQIQACEFLLSDEPGASPSEHDNFRWEWDD